MRIGSKTPHRSPDPQSFSYLCRTHAHPPIHLSDKDIRRKRKPWSSPFMASPLSWSELSSRVWEKGCEGYGGSLFIGPRRQVCGLPSWSQGTDISLQAQLRNKDIIFLFLETQSSKAKLSEKTELLVFLPSWPWPSPFLV